jgi:hypothetical protein
MRGAAKQRTQLENEMKLSMRMFLMAGVMLTYGVAGTSNAEAGGLLAKLFKGKCCAAEPECCEPEPEPEPECCCEPAPEPEPVCCEPEPEPVCCEPEPEPVCCEPEPEPEPEPAPCCASYYPLPELAEGEILLSISPITFPSRPIVSTSNESSVMMLTLHGR